MNIISPLFLGTIIAFLGVLPPGLINMTVVKISLKDGKNRAFMFVFGALIVIFFQTLVALIFAKYINSHIEIALLLRQIGFVVFSLLTFYFFLIAKKSSNTLKSGIKIKSKKSRFFLGMFISAINFFPIPFYVFITINLASFGYFSFSETSIYLFTLGVVLGSFFGFYGYMKFIKNLEDKSNFISNNINKIIGSVTAFVAIMSLIYILKNSNS